MHKPDGTPLLVYVPKAVGSEHSEAQYAFLHTLRKEQTRNRGVFSGTGHKHTVREDGFLSKSKWSEPVPSVVLGSLDPAGGRSPFCRQSYLTARNGEGWGAMLPGLQDVARAMQAQVPKRYDAQMGAAQKTHPFWLIPGTPFTTLTVNNTFPGAYHYDAGDYKAGFGAMSVIRRGDYRGCELVFPMFGCAVDLYDRDLVLFDPHELHGNTPFFAVKGEPQAKPVGSALDWTGVEHERISIVHYFREKVAACESPERELEKARARGDHEREDESEYAEAPE